MNSELHKYIRTSSFLLAFLTVMWIIFTGISMSEIKPSWSDYEYIKWISKPDIFYILNYINATLLTLLVIILYTLIFQYIYNQFKISALVAFAFVPIYGLLNLVCYSLQIAVVPSLSNSILSNSADLSMVIQMVQSKNNTLVGFLNGLAYSVLGIPSIIYGYLLAKLSKKISGYLLIINGVMCILGLIGYMIKDPILSNGIMAGGIIFLVGILFMGFEFRRA